MALVGSTAIAAILVVATLATGPGSVAAPPVAGRAAPAAVAGPTSRAVAPRAAVSAPAIPRATTALTRLVNQSRQLARTRTKLLPPKRKAQLTRLVTLAGAAKASVKTRTCASVRTLTKYRRAVGGVRLRTKPRIPVARTRTSLAGLSTNATKISVILLGTPRTKACGGGTPPSTRTQSQTTVVQSTDGHLKLQVGLPAVQLLPATGGGKSFVKLLAPDTTSLGRPGQPSVPTVSGLFAVPDGAKVSVRVSGVKTMTIKGVQLYPTQTDPADGPKAPDFTAPPFAGLPFVAETPLKGTFPAKPAQAATIGSSRGVRIGRLAVAGAQYTPSSDTLKVITKLTLDIRFTGGSGQFGGSSCSPYELSAARLVSGLANAAAVAKDCRYQVQRCGEEVLVVTNSATLDQAVRYAQGRQADGFRTRIVVTDGARGIGTSATTIRAYVRDQLGSRTCIRPSYLTLIGDDDLVPTFPGILEDPAKPSGGRIPSDNPYSTANDADELPDIAVGRILGDNATEVGNLVAKINHYAATPPTGAMLRRATIASYFQDSEDDPTIAADGREERSFVQFSETLRTGLMRRDVTVDRIFNAPAAITPKKFQDGTDLPSSLKRPTFAWDGDAAGISAAWNQGRFLMVHRDHGFSTGWGDPRYTTTELAALTNDNDHLPVVMSINCKSASYDTSDVSFAQVALVKATGGAVAVFGDTRNSPSDPNSVFGLGVADGLLPWVLSGEGPSAPQRLGDALNTGKLRLASSAAPSTPTSSTGSYSTRKELYLWHLFGDPTMKMYGGTSAFQKYVSSDFDVQYIRITDPDPTAPGFGVRVTMPIKVGPGQPVSLIGTDTDNGAEYVIGKAITNGSTDLVVPAQTDEAQGTDRSNLRIVLDADNAVPLTVYEGIQTGGPSTAATP